MRCTVCGREAMNPEANFCDYCGSPFHKSGEDGWNAPSQSAYPSGAAPEAEYTAFGTAEYREEAYDVQRAKNVQQGRDISVWMFLGVMCLQFVPVIGLFAYIGVLLFWGFSSQIVDARKNWARAALIYTGIVIVVFFSYLKTLMGLMGGLQ